MDVKYLKQEYDKKKKIIKKRLKGFSKVKGDDIFYELCFCLLTPQSNAFKCDECVCILRKRDFINKSFNIEPILKTKTRFYKNKSNYLMLLKKQYIINENSNNNGADGAGDAPSGVPRRTFLRSKNGRLPPLLLLEFSKDNKKIRQWLVDNIKGLGYKEASHLLRNIGYRNLAILDRHILRNLQKLKIINIIPKNLNKNNYLSIEREFYQFSKKINML